MFLLIPGPEREPESELVSPFLRQGERELDAVDGDGLFLHDIEITFIASFHPSTIPARTQKSVYPRPTRMVMIVSMDSVSFVVLYPHLTRLSPEPPSYQGQQGQ